MFRKISSWIDKHLTGNVMKWIGRGCAIVFPAAVGYCLHEMGRGAGMVETAEKELTVIKELAKSLDSIDSE